MLASRKLKGCKTTEKGSVLSHHRLKNFGKKENCVWKISVYYVLRGTVPPKVLTIQNCWSLPSQKTTNHITRSGYLSRQRTVGRSLQGSPCLPLAFLSWLGNRQLSGCPQPPCATDASGHYPPKICPTFEKKGEEGGRGGGVGVGREALGSSDPGMGVRVRLHRCRNGERGWEGEKV